MDLGQFYQLYLPAAAKQFLKIASSTIFIRLADGNKGSFRSELQMRAEGDEFFAFMNSTQRFTLVFKYPLNG